MVHTQNEVAYWGADRGVKLARKRETMNIDALQ